MADRKEKEFLGLKLKLYGIVQGVGFRPFAARLAADLDITGSVKNNGGSVDITAYGEKDKLIAFYQALFAKKPRQAQIVHREAKWCGYNSIEEFTIEKSEDTDGYIFIPADISVCEDCARELEDVNDPRYRHPFISCMACGPRYSIIEHIPYDRETTAMRDFEMCGFCEAGYKDVKNRRYHAQTSSCHDCGPELILQETEGKNYYGEAALNRATEMLQTGGMLAVKGIGGYHLACLPFDENAVLRLRELKQRELKPFAVMFNDIEDVKQYGCVSQREEELLLSDARPIVLLDKGKKQFAPSVCMDSRFVGAFLYYTPLQALLLNESGPLVMTSANVSDDPIIKDDDEMLQWGNTHLDGILYNKRRIEVRLDDSLVKVTGSKTQMLRRARGFAPLPVALKGINRDRRCVFAAGGHLKASFCITDAPFAYASQYMGGLDNENNIAEYEKNYLRMKGLFHLRPELAVCDMHPYYESTNFAKSLGLPLLTVQHHHGHIASVMAEHGLTGPVIGASFDGTGYGTDGSIWGGEFLICEGESFIRAGHLKYIKTVAGDESMKDASKIAMCHLYAAGLEDEIEDDRWPLIKAALDHDIQTHKNSSMGRLFDAVSAYIGVCGSNRYEAECAIKLENLADEAMKLKLEPINMSFGINEEAGMIIADPAPLWQVLRKQKNGDKRKLALGLHFAVADIAEKIFCILREKRTINQAALSGGVFQNSVLLNETIKRLKAKGFEVYINEAVPPNDSGLSLGQAYIGLMNKENK